ncbi:glycosyltransferase family 4 protein [Candidatus Magnetominusculus xianensis]|uniref:Mannosyltransferase n=1 Tax=Candidatus Magnetominusculus xianensis TaxID=1748249 RepID=A0ABR5SHP5_9BACT|nr:glycosyltransferase family 1 protein [Candidatus Magnetominusculus xianensis]KWT89412.1 mannosyltransferase [Candidatus Magnetominusculus xianensis]MBF0405501.1 glycosyltransferase family 4 protein [Nitrospirota bacterium]
MRLAIDATILEDARPSGIGTAAINIVNELASIHDDLIVWTVDDSMLRVDRGRLHKVFINSRRLLGNNIYMARAAWTQFFLPALIKKAKADVFYTPIPEGIFYPPLPHPMPQIVTVYDIQPILYKSNVPLMRYLSFKYRLPLVFRSARKLIAMSENTKKDIIKHYGTAAGKIEVVHGAINSGHFKPPAPHSKAAVLDKYALIEGRYFLYVGSVLPSKNIETLIDAFSSVSKDYALVIAGRRPDQAYERRCNAMIRDRLISNVRFLDYVPYDELPALYNGACANVLVSLIEGFGLPPLEAMASATAVIVSNRGSLPEIVGDAAIVVDAMNIGEIAQAMRRLASDEALRSGLIKKGLERVRKFSWRSTAERILAICKESL